MVDDTEVWVEPLAFACIDHDSGNEISQGIFLLADSFKQDLGVKDLFEVLAHLGKPPIEIGLESLVSIDGLVVEGPIRQLPGFSQSLLILERAVERLGEDFLTNGHRPLNGCLDDLLGLGVEVQVEDVEVRAAVDHSHEGHIYVNNELNFCTNGAPIGVGGPPQPRR